MTADFNMQPRSQQEWSWLVAMDLFLGGLGGALFLFFLFLKLPAVVGLLSLGLVTAGGVVLLAELGHPARAWRAICRPFSSWISRGVIFVLLFLVTGSLTVAPLLASFSWLPWTPETFVGRMLGTIAGVSALLVTLYPGFVLAASPSIPSWNTPLLPVLFFSNSVIGATGILLLLSSFGFRSQGIAELNALAALLLIANFVLLVVHVLVLGNSGISAQESVRRLREGSLGGVFRWGVVLVGTIVPLLIVVLLPSAAALAGACVLVGGVLFRYCVLEAGVYVPFALT
jgi:formate-dependent nitrite reductase membrane component NrfD